MQDQGHARRGHGGGDRRTDAAGSAGDEDGTDGFAIDGGEDALMVLKRRRVPGCRELT
jgi:hypothetical protein